MSLQPSFKSHKNHRSLIRWVKRSLLIVGALAVLGMIVLAWMPHPLVVDTARVRSGELVVTIDEDGRTRVHDRYVVAAPITGTLLRIDLDPGAAVVRGQILARITPPDPGLLDRRTREEAAARLAAAVANQRGMDTAIARATAARDAAIRDADRARQLIARDAIARSELERYELAEQLAIRDLSAAEAQRTAAAAQVAALRATLADTEGGARGVIDVKAPVDGRVLRVDRDSAGPVLAGTPLLELGDPGRIEIVVDLLSSDAARVTPGMDVEIDAWGGDEVLHGRVTEIEPSAFTKISALGVEEQRVNVIASITNAPRSLGDGFRVETHVITWRGNNVRMVPASAVFRDRDHWAVYAVESGRARLREVTLGHRGRRDIELVSGLPDGTAVIAHPTDKIKDGVRVTPAM